MRKWLIYVTICTISINTFLTTTFAKTSPKKFIYKIEAKFDHKYKSDTSVHSEFVGIKLKKYNGILSVFHGVSYSFPKVAKIWITKSSSTTREEFIIQSVDLENDICLLVPKESKTKLYKDGEGFDLDTTTIVREKLNFSTYGFEIGNYIAHHSDLKCSDSEEKINANVNKDDIKSLRLRGSPSENIMIIPISSDTKLGSSGCPLITQSNNENLCVVGIVGGGRNDSPLGFSFGYFLKGIQFKRIDDEGIASQLEDIFSTESDLFHSSFIERPKDRIYKNYPPDPFGSFISRAVDQTAKSYNNQCKNLRNIVIEIFGSTINGRRTIGKRDYLIDSYPVCSYLIRTAYHYYCSHEYDSLPRDISKLKESLDRIEPKEQKIIERHIGYDKLNKLITACYANFTFSEKFSKIKELLNNQDYENALALAKKLIKIKYTPEVKNIIKESEEAIVKKNTVLGDSSFCVNDFKDAIYHYKIALNIYPESRALNSKLMICLVDTLVDLGGIEKKDYIKSRIQSTFNKIIDSYSNLYTLPNTNTDVTLDPENKRNIKVSFQYGMLNSKSKFEKFSSDFEHFNFPPGKAEYVGAENAMNMYIACLNSIVRDSIISLKLDSVKITISGCVDALPFKFGPHRDITKYGHLDYYFTKYGILLFHYNEKLGLYRAAFAREKLKKLPFAKYESYYDLKYDVDKRVGGVYRKVMIAFDFYGNSSLSE